MNGEAGSRFSVQDLLTRGIDAFAETQIARYTANDPTPNNRGVNDTTAPAGQPAFSRLANALTNPMTLLLLVVAAGVVWFIARR